MGRPKVSWRLVGAVDFPVYLDVVVRLLCDSHHPYPYQHVALGIGAFPPRAFDHLGLRRPVRPGNAYRQWRYRLVTERPRGAQGYVHLAGR